MYCSWFKSNIQQEDICTWYVKVLYCLTAPTSFQKKLHKPKPWICEGYSVLSFNFEIFDIDVVGRATLFLSFTFLDTMFSNNYVFFIVLYCKDVWNTGNCVMINALKYERLLLICRDYFLRLAFAFGCMYFFGTLLWKCQIFNFLYDAVLPGKVLFSTFFS